MADEVKKHPGGRPLKYKTVEELNELINRYFDYCDENKEPYTVTGLARSLGMTRQMLVEYEQKDEFGDTIKDAKSRVEEYAEKSLWWCKNPAGPIFNLKNNYGWKDKQEIDTNINLNTADMIKKARSRVEETE